MNFELIVAFNKKGVIGKDNTIPWHVPEDLKYFQKTTKGHIIVMGRKTYESLPNGPLKNRINIVITNNPSHYTETETLFFTSMTDVQSVIRRLQYKTNKKVFIIGGNMIYKHFFESCNRYHITVIDNDVDGDTYFPYTLDYFNNNFKKTHEDNVISRVNNTEFTTIIFE